MNEQDGAERTYVCSHVIPGCASRVYSITDIKRIAFDGDYVLLSCLDKRVHSLNTKNVVALFSGQQDPIYVGGMIDCRDAVELSAKYHVNIANRLLAIAALRPDPSSDYASLVDLLSSTYGNRPTFFCYDPNEVVNMANALMLSPSHRRVLLAAAERARATIAAEKTKADKEALSLLEKLVLVFDILSIGESCRMLGISQAADIVDALAYSADLNISHSLRWTNQLRVGRVIGENAVYGMKLAAQAIVVHGINEQPMLVLSRAERLAIEVAMGCVDRAQVALGSKNKYVVNVHSASSLAKDMVSRGLFREHEVKNGTIVYKVTATGALAIGLTADEFLSSEQAQ